MDIEGPKIIGENEIFNDHSWCASIVGATQNVRLVKVSKKNCERGKTWVLYKF